MFLKNGGIVWNLREFEIKEGITIKLDDEAYDAVSQYRWSVIKPFLNQSKIVFDTYLKDKNGKPTHIRLHRFVMGNPPREFTVMFRNNDRFDLQKSNLCLVKNHTTWLRKYQNKLKKF
jgi:hypothetical protein